MTDQPDNENDAISAEVMARYKMIADFVNSPDWSIARDILEKTPALLEPEMLSSFDEMILAAVDENNLEMAHHLFVHRGLVEIISEKGIEHAFETIQAPPARELLQTIANFVNASDWETTREILDAHPELLTVKASAALEAFVIAAKDAGDPQRIHLLSVHRDLLLSVHLFGVDQAFEQMPEPVDEEVVQTIAKFVYAGDTENARAVLEEHPELLEPEVDVVFTTVINDASMSGQEDFVLLLEVHQQLLRLAREVGIEAAFAQTLALPQDNLMNMVVEFVNSEGVEGSRAYLETNPDILTEEAEEAFDSLIQTAKSTGQEEMVHHLIVYRDLLRMAREDGIEEAFSHVSTPDDLLDTIVKMTIYAVTEDDPDIRKEWLVRLGTFNAQAQELQDDNMAKLTDVIARLLLGGKPENLSPKLTGTYKEAWDEIVRAYMK